MRSHMPFSETDQTPDFDALSAAYLRPEPECVADLAEIAEQSTASRRETQALAATLTYGLLEDAKRLSAVDAFLNAYSLSSDEGVLLMRLAESLIRTPDPNSARLLLRDKIAAGRWLPHMSAKHALVKLGTLGLAAAKGWTQISGGPQAGNPVAQLGDRVMLLAVRQAIASLGRHFVLGTSIEAATRRAAGRSDYNATYSYDMLGEAAMTEADADRYLAAYMHALNHLAATSPPREDLHQSPSLSVKLSALHPRYEYAQRDRCVPALASRLLTLCARAKAANIGLTVDAEEVDRLEVSLLVIEQVLASEKIRGWDGFGLAVQAYQKRALPLIDWLEAASKRHAQYLTVRLVKGAYWDSEIKRAQELGLADYPVFTRKEHTDISYLACARRLLDAEGLYPQFATHNAHSVAAIVSMAGSRRDFEIQRLHGMSDGLHYRLATEHQIASRTYAPVGRHKDLLPYLVRRLLENGANASFVNQLLETDGDIQSLIEDPIAIGKRHGFSPHPVILSPCVRAGERRKVAAGEDLTQSDIAMDIAQTPRPFSDTPAPAPADIHRAIEAACASDWQSYSVADRSEILRRAADLLERDRSSLMAQCVFEAHKTWPDAEAELREAVDFLRYYADQAERPAIAARDPLGPVACISPWNFPLAIFLGQVGAALSVGNTVLAKPAEQTPLIAGAAIKRLYEAGVPETAVQLFLGDGRIGAELVAHPAIKAVCFTGSTETAKKIALSLAENGRGDTPLIAETGGINAMIIDSTALLEQAVRDVIASAFQSAGQRCSACRLVCVQDDVADAFMEMFAGAMKTLRVDAPSRLSTDLGPLIDTNSQQKIAQHISTFRQRHRVIAEAPAPAINDPTFIAPIAFELNSINALQQEVFGPVLHIVRFKSSALKKVIAQINALGFGLTMGLHTRIDSRVTMVKRAAQVGNLYVNRNQIGAIVGEQPFGGEGLSGTGPKAGGPNYLARLSRGDLSTSSFIANRVIHLPGPTGEQNTLRYVSRGRLLCAGGDDELDLTRQMLRANETGNVPVFLGTKSLEQALADETLDGVIGDGQVRQYLALALARRPGPILPLLSMNDSDDRYMLERVVSIDTTAAGGNASLLANT